MREHYRIIRKYRWLGPLAYQAQIRRFLKWVDLGITADTEEDAHKYIKEKMQENKVVWSGVDTRNNKGNIDKRMGI